MTVHELENAWHCSITLRFDSENEVPLQEHLAPENVKDKIHERFHT